jgi:hypothetical protein
MRPSRGETRLSHFEDAGFRFRLTTTRESGEASTAE